MTVEHVRITDVSPRDGLQNEPGVILTADKVRLIELLTDTGVDEIELTSFVSPKWVPQLGDAAEVIGALKPPHRGRGFSALVPNIKGMESAVTLYRAAGIPNKVSVFTAASETFSSKNTNASIAQTIERFKPVMDLARENDLPVRGYISCVIACPFEGAIAPAKVAEVAEHLVSLGVDEIDLGDTIGAATPESTAAMLDTVARAIGDEWLDWHDDSEPFITLHLHDTFSRAADCVKAALDTGVRSFDASVAGLGGCPYASTPGNRAPGNISTETLVQTVHDAGFVTNVDLDRLNIAAVYARTMVARSRAAASSQGAT